MWLTRSCCAMLRASRGYVNGSSEDGSEPPSPAAFAAVRTLTSLPATTSLAHLRRLKLEHSAVLFSSLQPPDVCSLL